MTTHTTQPGSHPVDRLLADIATGTGVRTDIWSADARLDATVPNWRFEASGPVAVAGTLSNWFDAPITIENLDRRPTAEGEVVSFDLGWVEDGMPMAAHQVHVLDIEGDRITADTAFCGGRWPAGLLAEMEAARVG